MGGHVLEGLAIDLSRGKPHVGDAAHVIGYAVNSYLPRDVGFDGGVLRYEAFVYTLCERQHNLSAHAIKGGVDRNVVFTCTGDDQRELRATAARLSQSPFTDARLSRRRGDVRGQRTQVAPIHN